ncbi:hypothetical protein BN1708_017788, partial [Verticillium longisporum]
MLLLGGFTLAAALSKCKIDKRLATFVLSKAGTTPRTVLVANMLVAAFASMLISNVAAPDKDEDTPSIYHTLLSLYLTPPAPHNTALEPALDLLSKHGSRLPATSTMSLIPSTLPVSELESYFRGRIRSANSVVNESRIVAGLRATEYISSQALLLLGDGIPGGQGGRNRRVVITDERLCGVCHKRLGGSVVSVLPDNTVVHYGCLNRATAQK